MPVVFANFAETALAADVASSATVFPVVSTAGFPSLSAGQYFYLVLSTSDGQREIVRCTSIGGSDFVVQRGVEGTTPRAWAAGTRVVLAVTKAALDEFFRVTGGTISADLPSITLYDTITTATARFKAAGDTAGRAEGHALVDVGLPPGSVNRIARLRLFRETTAPDGAVVEVFRSSPVGVVHRLYNDGIAHFALGGGSVAIGHDTPQATLDVGGVTGVLLPRGTTAERPASPVVGMLRFNTTDSRYEVYDGAAWQPLGLITSVDPLVLQLVETVSSGAVLSLAHAADVVELVGGVLQLRRYVNDVTGTGDVSVTLPGVGAGVAAGAAFVVRNKSTGVLTINAPSGSTIDGASSVTVPWTDGVVYLLATAVSGSNVTWTATGDTSAGVTLPATRVRGTLTLDGAVQGGSRAVGATITSSMTLSATADVGVLRHVNGASVTVTVPSAFRGIVELVFDTAGTVAFEGGSPSSKSIAAGRRAIIDVHAVGSTVYRTVYEAVPL